MANSALELPTQNMIIGGNFDTNPWQRGTTFAGVAAAQYTADRFQEFFIGAGGGIFTIRKTANAPTVAQAGMLLNNCYEILTTTADVVIAAGDAYGTQQMIEGYNFAQLAQRPFTLSFWARSNVTGNYCVAFSNSISDRSYVADYTINAVDTWEYKTITVPASPSAGTWNYTNGIGLTVSFLRACGVTYTTPANVWTVGTFYASGVNGVSSNQVNNVAGNNNYLMIDAIQVIAGSQPKSFERRTVQQELALCQRYFYKTYLQGVAPGTLGALAGYLSYRTSVAGAVAQSASLDLPVTMRTHPGTITRYNPVNANANWHNLTTGADSGASALNQGASNKIDINNPGVAGDNPGEYMVLHFTASAEL